MNKCLKQLHNKQCKFICIYCQKLLMLLNWTLKSIHKVTAWWPRQITMKPLCYDIKQQRWYLKSSVMSCSALAPADMQSKLLQYKNNHHFTAIIQVSRHFQLRTGGLCWCLHTLEDGNSVQCRHLLNKVANIDRMPDISCTLKWDGRCHPKLPLSFDGIRAPNLIQSFSGPPEYTTQKASQSV